MVIEDSDITGNSVAYGTRGGGLYFNNADVSIEGSRIGNNQVSMPTSFASGSGGGIWHGEGSLSISGSLVDGNRAGPGGGFGGGVFAFLVETEFINSTITGNSAGPGRCGTPLSGNGGDGGGLFQYGGSLSVQLTTITNNHTGSGCASDGGSSGRGGGVRWIGNVATAKIENSIIAGNVSDGPFRDISNDRPNLDLRYSLIGDVQGANFSSSVGNVLDTDPLLGPLADNGGRLRTHALSTGSPAINHGDPLALAGASGVPVFDQRGDGFARVAFGQVDMGAFEVQTANQSGDFNGDGRWDTTDVDALVNAIFLGAHEPLFDMNGDSLVDHDELDRWLEVAGMTNLPSGAPYSYGDANLDGFVDVGDFNLWNQNKFRSVAAWSSGDFNADGSVDVGDFNIWNQNKFTSAFRRTEDLFKSGPSRIVDLVFGDNDEWSLLSR